MILNYVKSRSSVYPETVDTASSKTTVYLRRNIAEVKTECGIMYEYDEAKLTKEKYEQYITESAIPDSITDLQLAVAEIYEMLLKGGV